MIWKNVEIHNIAELCENDNGVTWRRVPKEVHDSMELSKNMALNSTGVELRFVMKSDEVTLRMAAVNEALSASFHIYRGSVQGSWDDFEVDKVICFAPHDFVIKKSQNEDFLRRVTDECNYPFAPEVIRVIFDRGYIKLLDIIGDVEPPKPEQLPRKTLLTYGSSITHGSNAMDMSHAWASCVAYNLNMDCRNLGMAGSCAMEPSMADYIAGEGEKGRWDIATLELGINVLHFEESKARERVYNIVKQVAGRNPDKRVYVISPFYCCDDFNGGKSADMWRRVIEDTVNELSFPNVKYISGLELLGDISLISADEVHPNIYGAQQIAERLTAIIKNAE